MLSLCFGLSGPLGLQGGEFSHNQEKLRSKVCFSLQPLCGRQTFVSNIQIFPHIKYQVN